MTVMRNIRKVKDRDALREWDAFFKAFSQSAEVDAWESEADQEARKQALLDDFEAFAKYYFPGVAKSEFADWHRKYFRYVIKNGRAKVTAKVARDMAKSSVTAMLIVFLYFKGEVKSVGYFSHIQTQAAGLLNAVKIAFEKNTRLIHDFGSQVGLNTWTVDRFVTITGASFRAIGAGQNPRGEKNEDSDRFDLVVFDDFDDPEVCRSPERLDIHWKYVLGDVFPAFHGSGRQRVIFLNNKIAEDCIVQRAEDHFKAIADQLEVKPLAITVNLTDGSGRSNWPGAFTDQQCREMIALAGEEAETEYFNNPSTKGKEFKPEWMQFKRMPPLSQYRHLIVYHDGGFAKGTKTSDMKALVLVGLYKDEYHIRRVYVDHVSIPGAIAWHYDLHARLTKAGATAVWYMEEVFLTSLMYEHYDREAAKYGFHLPIKGDKRKKPDKDLRISGIAGHFERGHVFFDESIRLDRHTRTLIDQFLRFRKGGRGVKRDGPDAIEGAMFLLREMVVNVTDFTTHLPPINKKRI